ncbi:MAG: hypothetical protein F4137_03885 [Acidobacteria bacterium]|nr:hypothetical protein [Acidobacteriota bacterium]MYH27999.1 hypothetical protein [Acidobacteriota bacterium]
MSFRFVLLFVVLAGLVPSLAPAQTLGQVFVEVTRRSTGEPVLNLAPDAFEVSEDGRSAGIVSANLDAAPMKIAVLIDNGDRLMETSALNPLRAGLDGFLDTLAPGHKISLVTIGRSVQQRVDFTTDRAELKDGVGLLFPDRGAGARLLDGVRETWDRRFEEDDAFPVMVLVLTDGTETSGSYNDNRYADLLNPLIANGVTIHAVMLATRGGVRAQQRLPQYALSLVENTGGSVETFVAPTGYERVLPQLAERMNEHYGVVSRRYRLVFERPDPPGMRLSVSVTGSDLTFSLHMDRRTQR